MRNLYYVSILFYYDASVFDFTKYKRRIALCYGRKIASFAERGFIRFGAGSVGASANQKWGKSLKFQKYCVIKDIPETEVKAAVQMDAVK